MAKEFSRTRRLGEQIQRELAELIQREIKDPRVGFVTVSAVEVSRDLSHAKVFITQLGDDTKRKEMLAVLTHAGGFLRRELGRRLTMRIVPTLAFVYDTSIERGTALVSLINEAVAQEHDVASDVDVDSDEE